MNDVIHWLLMNDARIRAIHNHGVASKCGWEKTLENMVVELARQNAFLREVQDAHKNPLMDVIKRFETSEAEKAPR